MWRAPRWTSMLLLTFTFTLCIIEPISSAASNIYARTHSINDINSNRLTLPFNNGLVVIDLPKNALRLPKSGLSRKQNSQRSMRSQQQQSQSYSPSMAPSRILPNGGQTNWEPMSPKPRRVHKQWSAMTSERRGPGESVRSSSLNKKRMTLYIPTVAQTMRVNSINEQLPSYRQQQGPSSHSGPSSSPLASLQSMATGGHMDPNMLRELSPLFVPIDSRLPARGPSPHDSSDLLPNALVEQILREIIPKIEAEDRSRRNQPSVLHQITSGSLIAREPDEGMPYMNPHGGSTSSNSASSYQSNANLVGKPKSFSNFRNSVRSQKLSASSSSSPSSSAGGSLHQGGYSSPWQQPSQQIQQVQQQQQQQQEYQPQQEQQQVQQRPQQQYPTQQQQQQQEEEPIIQEKEPVQQQSYEPLQEPEQQQTYEPPPPVKGNVPQPPPRQPAPVKGSPPPPRPQVKGPPPPPAPRPPPTKSFIPSPPPPAKGRPAPAPAPVKGFTPPAPAVKGFSPPPPVKGFSQPAPVKGFSPPPPPPPPPRPSPPAPIKGRPQVQEQLPLPIPAPVKGYQSPPPSPPPAVKGRPRPAPRPIQFPTKGQRPVEQPVKGRPQRPVQIPQQQEQSYDEPQQQQQQPQQEEYEPPVKGQQRSFGGQQRRPAALTETSPPPSSTTTILYDEGATYTNPVEVVTRGYQDAPNADIGFDDEGASFSEADMPSKMSDNLDENEPEYTNARLQISNHSVSDDYNQPRTVAPIRNLPLSPANKARNERPEDDSNADGDDYEGENSSSLSTSVGSYGERIRRPSSSSSSDSELNDEASSHRVSVTGEQSKARIRRQSAEECVPSSL